MFGEVKEIVGNKLLIIVEQEEKNVIEVNVEKIKCGFSLRKGDHLELVYDKAQKLAEIEPCVLDEDVDDEISRIFDGYGIVGHETIFYFDDDESDDDTIFNVGDTLNYDCIMGDYSWMAEKISHRCISFKKIASTANPIQAYSPEEQAIRDRGYVTFIPKVIEEAFPLAKLREYYEEIPIKLRALITETKNSTKIRAELDELMPSELNISTYEKMFHNLIHLEELNLLNEFKKYTKDDAAFTPKRKDKNMFTLDFEDLWELRPSILRGDHVEATNNETKDQFIGIVVRTLQNSMEIRFMPEFGEQFDQGITYTVEFLYSAGAYQKLHKGVEKAVSRLGVDFLFPSEVGIVNSPQLNVKLDGGALNMDDIEIPWFKADIDDSQKIAVVQALRAELRPLPNIIHGPPGTGKTSTLIEIILHIFTRLPNSRILIATHSNSAANLVLTRLLSHDFLNDNIVRLLGAAYQEKTVILDELIPFCGTLRLRRRGEDDLNDAEENQTESGVKIFRHLECVAPFRIVIGTCVGLGPLLYDRNDYVPDYSHVFVDEAGQCSEPEVLIPISKLSKKNGSVVLAGDHKQMPPLVLSNFAKERGLSKSLLERLIEQYTEIEKNLKLKNMENHVDLHLISRLLYSYRSLPSLLQFYNKHFYENALRATISDSDSPEAEVLRKIQEVLPKNAKRNLKHAIYCHNIIGTNKQIKGSNSWYNSDENFAILTFIPKLLDLGFTSDDIGVITPYHLQVKTLRQHFAKKQYSILVGSVDEFQGLERKIIIISTVRTNKFKVMMDIHRKMGIVACPQRTNVAISRARAVVVLFGRADLLLSDKYWGPLIKDCKENGTYYES